MTKPAKTHALRWNPVPDTLPPGAEGHWFSPKVWLAISDGRMLPGKCLHKAKGASFSAPVHSWFIEKDDCSSSLPEDLEVIAWMPFAVPDHPGLVLQTRQVVPRLVAGVSE